MSTRTRTIRRPAGSAAHEHLPSPAVVLEPLAKHIPERLDRRWDCGEGSACAALLQNAGSREVACFAIVDSARG